METTLQMHASMHTAPLQAVLSILLASTLLISSAEPPPPSYRFDLIHVDANGNFSREQLIHRAAKRTFLREATLSALDSTASSTEYSVTAVDASYSYHEYLMKLQIGSPPKPFMAVADTGSDVTWTKEMKLCDKTSSSSLTSMTCSEKGPGCSVCFLGRCMFTKTYGSQKITALGFMSSDMLTMSQEKKVPVRIGCAFYCGDGNCHRMLPETADGLVGLSRGPNSLLAQLNVNKFSYCLSRPILEPVPRSQFWFGDGLTLGESGAPVNTTLLVDFTAIDPPIKPNSVWANRYYVELYAISIGGERMELVSKNEDHEKLRSKTGNNPIMFLDSGCSYSLLETRVFKILMKLLEKHGLKNPKSTEKFSTCFAGTTTNDKPQMVLHFTGADMTLPWTSYMLEDESCFCLAIKETDKVASILGNFQQQNIRMLYDTSKNELSFVRVNDCDKL